MRAGDATLSTPSLSLTPGDTMLMLVRWLGYGLAFFLFAQAGRSRSRALVMMKALHAICLIYAALGLAMLILFGDTILGIEKWSYQGVATATFVNRNSFATFIAFGFAIGVALFASSLMPNEASESPARGRRLLYGVGLGLSLAALITSGSRMGLLTALVAGGVVLILAFAGRRPEARAPLVVLLVTTLAGVLLLVLFGGRLSERLSGIENDAEGRFDLYRQVWTMISHRPLAGYGGGSFEMVFQLFHLPPLSPDVIWNKAHSSYLTLAAELGLPAAIFIVASLVALGWRTMRSLNDPSISRRVPLAALGVMTVAALHSLVDFSLEIQANAYFFAAVLGLTFGYLEDRPTIRGDRR